MVNIKNRYNLIVVIVIAVAVIPIIILLSLIIRADEIGEISAAAVDNINGNVAIAYMDASGTNNIEVYDKSGNLIFNSIIVAGGGVVYNLYFDDTSILHVQSRNKKEDLIDNCGVLIGQCDKNTMPSAFTGWEKKGSVYSLTIDNVNYCYDTLSLTEFFINPHRSFFIQKDDNTVIEIWKSK